MEKTRRGTTVAKLQTEEATEKLTVEDYARRAALTDTLGPELATSLIGLFGEVGSLLSALKKKRRDADAYFGYQAAVTEELGDVLWYLSAIARRSRIKLADVLGAAIDRPSASTRALRFSHIRAPAHLPREEDFERSLMQLAAEAGELIKRFEAGAFIKNIDALRSDLIKLVRPLVRSAGAANIQLAKAAYDNLVKIEGWRPPRRIFPTLFDNDLHRDEQLPRKIEMAIYEREVNKTKFVFQKCNGVLVGDRLTDNHEPPDDYRFHDVFHLSYAAVLGWSPVVRALFRVKRKSDGKLDENEDGARANLIEEGLTTWIFEKAKDHQFFGATPKLGFDLLKAVQNFVRGYEPQYLPLWLWEKAILDGYSIFRKLRKQRRGLVIADLKLRNIRFEKLRYDPG